MSELEEPVVEQREEDSAAVYGVVAEFASPESLLAAIRGAREHGYSKLDAFTPFPVHGIDEALGAQRSPLGWIVLAAGLAGAAAALLLIWWTGAVDSPLVVAGKPLFAFEFAVPVTFELAVLLAAFGAVAGMFLFNGLPRLYHPVFRHSRFERATDDRFLLAIEAGSNDFNADAAAETLRALSGKHVEVIAK
jgi:hypothetical protein